MSERKWTNERWRVEASPFSGDYWIKGRVGMKDEILVHVSGDQSRTKSDKATGGTTHYNVPVKHAKERAHLIAASPALFVALEPLATLEPPKRPSDRNAGAYSIRFADIERARAALKKARGEI